MIEDNGEREITPNTLLDFFDNSICLTHSKIFFAYEVVVDHDEIQCMDIGCVYVDCI